MNISDKKTADSSGQKARDFWDLHHRELDDLYLILAPDDLKENIIDITQIEDAKAAIALYYPNNEQETITNLGLIVPSDKHSQIESILSNSSIKFNHEIQPDSGRKKTHFRVQFIEKTGKAKISKLVSDLLSLLLITGRPLNHYTCTFFLPLGKLSPEWQKIKSNNNIERFRLLHPSIQLAQRSDSKNKEKDTFQNESEAYYFFDGRLRDLITDTQRSSRKKGTDPKPLQHWRIKPDKAKAMQLQAGNHIAKVSDVSLFRNHLKLNLLSITVGIQGILSDLENNTWWWNLFYSEVGKFEEIACTQVNNWLSFTVWARLLYPKFYEQVDEGKFHDLTLYSFSCESPIFFNKSDEFSPIIIHLLQHFLGTPPENTALMLKQRIADDRMFVHASYALSGPVPKQDTPQMQEFERLFSLALYVDRNAEYSTFSKAGYHAYDRQYLKTELMNEQVLRRWQEIGSISGFTGYSSVWMGFGSFFKVTISSKHVPFVYASLQRQILMTAMTLHWFDREISVASEEIINKGLGQKFRELRKRFIEFTNRYWFHQPTTEIQGKEIVSRQVEALNLGLHYATVKEKVEQADEFLSDLRQEKQTRQDTALSKAGFFLALAALFAGFGFTDIAGSTLWEWLKNKLAPICQISVEWLALIITTTVVIFFILFAIYIWKKETKDEAI